MSSNSVLDIPPDLHALRLNSNSPSMSLTQPNPPALADRHLPSYDLIPNGHDEEEANDMEELSLEIEKER